MKIPQIGGQELDLLKLYKSVCRRGGGQAVSNHKLWKEIVDEFGLPSSCTSASFTLKNHYQRYLLAYEQKFYFGKDDDTELPELVAGRQRKQPKTDEQKDYRFGPQRVPGQREDTQRNIGELEVELNRTYERVDRQLQMLFLKRSKMYPYLVDLKRIELGLQSGTQAELVFSLNTLLLYSVNTHVQFKFEQYPTILEALSVRARKLVPCQSAFALESMRMVTIIIRNLAMNPANLQPLLGSKLFEVLLELFQNGHDRECTKNIMDLMACLLKVSWDPKPAIAKVYLLLNSDRTEEVEIAVDFVRALTDDNHPSVEGIITVNKDILSCLFLSPSAEIR